MDELPEEITGGRRRWGVAKRLEFIEFRLFWYGRFNRSELAEAFGISPQQASADISKYETIAPGNLSYDRAQKVYLRTDDFEPRLVGASSDRFLLQVVAVENGWMPKEDTWFDLMPPVEVVSLKSRPTNAKHLLCVLDAIRNRREIELDYESLTGSGTPKTRIIAPHSLAHCAGRTYVRAWSRDHNDFRDYHLNRITQVRESRPNEIDMNLDFEWAHIIDLILIPNPDLKAEKREAVQTERQMTDGKLLVPCRLSLSFYLMSELNLDVEPGILKAEKQQLVLQNRQEVEQARRVTRELSMQALERVGQRK